jgi:hypothetical protein
MNASLYIIIDQDYSICSLWIKIRNSRLRDFVHLLFRVLRYETDVQLTVLDWDKPVLEWLYRLRLVDRSIWEDGGRLMEFTCRLRNILGD